MRSEKGNTGHDGSQDIVGLGSNYENGSNKNSHSETGSQFPTYDLREYNSGSWPNFELYNFSENSYNWNIGNRRQENMNDRRDNNPKGNSSSGHLRGNANQKPSRYPDRYQGNMRYNNLSRSEVEDTAQSGSENGFEQGRSYQNKNQGYYNPENMQEIKFENYQSQAGVPSPQLNYIPHTPNTSNYNPNSYSSNQQEPANMPFLTQTHYRLMLPEQVSINQHKKKGTYRIPLTSEGNLVIDLPAPRRLMSLAKYTQPVEEFAYMRYTAVTCNPDEFIPRGYKLKVQELGRRAELLIALTMYNEDETLFLRSLTSVLKNIRHFCSRNKSSNMWGKDGWKNIVVCIISDGRNKINHKVLGVLGVMGVYQDGIMKDHVNDKSVVAHLFEYTTQIYINESFEIKNAERGYVPTQIVFCLKEKNAKKINSHRWLFQAFAPLLSTNICILIDVGTRPSSTSLYHLWSAFKNSKIGGACGEIVADSGKYGHFILNPLVGAQNFEYKISNILDKPFESVCGYISVLPGAFSAYRYSALVGKPLRAYFLGETMENEVSLLTANTYLAEDRILCLELLAKRGAHWLLKYVRIAKARTDVPGSISELISQRRRWLNGSFCAGVHALLNSYRVIFISGHNIPRKLILLFEFFYNAVVLVLNWFGISLFFLTFYFVLKGSTRAVAISGRGPFLGYEEQVIFYSKYVYVMAIIAVFISSMGNRPQGLKMIFLLSVLTFAIFNMVILYVVGYQAVLTITTSRLTLERVPEALLTDRAFRTFAISILFTFVVFILSSLAHLSPWHLITSSIQYLIVMPTYINIMPIYSFCNLHDVSWGTKQSSTPSTDLGTAKTLTNDSGKSMFDVEIRGSQTEIDTNYGKFIKQLESDSKEKVKVKDIFTIREDYLKSFRTRVVLLWILTNGALSVLLTSDLLSRALYRRFGLEVSGNGDGAVNPFLTYFSYIMFFVNGVRFIGSLIYLIF